MSSHDPFEDQLRLEFSRLDVPAPSVGAFEKSVRRYRRWRLRRRLLVVTPGVAAAAGLGVALGLSGTSGHGPARSSSSKAVHLSGHNAMHLANYAFPLPPGFHTSSTATGSCRAVVTFEQKVRITRGSVPKAPKTPNVVTGKEINSTFKIASAASADGGCVEMALTIPFTPTTTTENPYLGFTVNKPSVRKVDVNGDVGWLTPAATNEGVSTPQLIVELPQGNGQMRDLGVSSAGLSANKLLTIVSQGLS